jgi:ABC-type glycerol-3-phosphate transport system permease component
MSTKKLDIVRKIREKTPVRLLSYTALIVTSLILLFPIFWMLSTGLKTSTQFPPVLFPASPSLKPLFNAFETGPWGRWFLNTAIFSVGATILTLLIATPAAYALARREFCGEKIVYLSIMALLVFPGQILALPLYIQFVQIGWTNSYIGLVLIYVTLFSAFTTFLMRGFFRSLPSDVEDAAQIAGISEWKTFFRIILPLVKPAIGVAAMFVFIFTWNEFLFALIFLNDQSMYTISIGLPVFQGTHGNTAANQMMAMAALSALPVLMMFVFAQESFIKGIATGYEF